MLGMDVLAVAMMMIVLIELRLADNHSERIELAVDIAGACSVTTPQRNVFLWRRAVRQNAQQGGASRSCQLAGSRRPVTHVEAFEKANGGRSRHREDPMGGFH